MKRIATMYVCALLMCSVVAFGAGYMNHTPEPRIEHYTKQVKTEDFTIIYVVPSKPNNPPVPDIKPNFVQAKFNRVNQDVLQKYDARNLEHLVEKMSGTEPTQMASK